MSPRNLTEAIEMAKRENESPNYAAKQMVEEIVERRPVYRFETTEYHAAPRTEMY